MKLFNFSIKGRHLHTVEQRQWLDKLEEVFNEPDRIERLQLVLSEKMLKHQLLGDPISLPTDEEIRWIVTGSSDPKILKDM